MEQSLVQDNKISDFDKIQRFVGYDANVKSPGKTSNNLKAGNISESSDEDQAPVQRVKKRIKRFTDSDSDADRENVQNPANIESEKNSVLEAKTDSELEEDGKNIMNNLKYRIQLNNSDTDESEDFKVVKNEEQQIRMKNKRDKIKNKFKNLLNSREKNVVAEKRKSEDSVSSGNSDTEMSSIKSIKQKIKESMSMIPSVCDPDTSDDEGMAAKKYVKPKFKKERKSTKPTSPKPIRMSAKQAMDNMHKIKSESNRMLREKEVSLPYHRPKALSLKDIMSRRKPALSSDGKSLPIKMNEEQLKQYAQLLEERQKEMVELCKSDTEDEETPEPDLNAQASLPETENPSNLETNHEIIDINCEHSENKSVNHQTANIVDNNIVGNDSTHICLPEPFKSTEISLTDNDKELQSNNSNTNCHTSEGQNSYDTDIKLVYNYSVEESITKDNVETVLENVSTEISGNILTTGDSLEQQITVRTEPESQLINLHYDTEKSEKCTEVIGTVGEPNIAESLQNEHCVEMDMSEQNHQADFLSDDDMNMVDIDRIIENAEILGVNEDVNSPRLVKDSALKINPKLTGAPGMVIDLDGNGSFSKKLTGIELLKERFSFFSKLKTPEELEREREKKIKPGAQLLKLKQELEEQIAEQRSLEWAKRLEDEKQHQVEMKAIRGDTSDAEDDIDKMEAKLVGSNEKESSSESEEEELIEDDVEIKDKPRRHNPMVDDAAVESEDEDNKCSEENQEEADEGIEAGDDGMDNENSSDSSSDDDESSESEEEVDDNAKPRKGRILKAFEDSDDEDAIKKDADKITTRTNHDSNKGKVIVPNSQDVEIQLAQRHKSASDDIFSSQDVGSVTSMPNESKNDLNINEEVATQTFSILDSKPSDDDFKSPEELNVISTTPPYHDPNLDVLASGLSQNVLNSQVPTQSLPSQPIGEDVLALCTGKFYDNEFVSQADGSQYDDPISQEYTNEFADDRPDGSKTLSKNYTMENNDDKFIETNKATANIDLIEDSIKVIGGNTKTVESRANHSKGPVDGSLLKSILDELDDPDFDEPKPNKFFTGATQKKNDEAIESTQLKKKFIIDSDDEAGDSEKPMKKKKKFKKKKAEQRALHISDDEEEEEEFEQDEEEYMSDIEDDTEKLVDYDSEENEIELIPQNTKKKRKAAEFLENEAELTSEDEWVGSGDEDEAGLDRMEREAGDDDVFNQGKLRNELGQIHMRDVLDQDKREVRLLQELLFEDGDLGDGHRQRKFRWRNADGDEETGTRVDEFGDTQEEEFESEEQWRKQRHEREVFLKQMQNKEEEVLNVSVNRNTIIKANLSSRTMSSLLMEVNQSKTENTETPIVPEKKSVKDIPSPKKSFAIFQQNYHGSLLTRGRGALARLAALATPLAADDDTPKIGSLAPSSKRNFVFAALTPDEKPKVTTKRKADTNLGTPKLVKKMKKEEKKTNTKSSLLDHLKAL